MSQQGDIGQPEEPTRLSPGPSQTEGQRRPQRTFYSSDIGEQFLRRTEESISQYQNQITQYQAQIAQLTQLLERALHIRQPDRSRSPTPFYEPTYEPPAQPHQVPRVGEESPTGDGQNPLPAQAAQAQPFGMRTATNFVSPHLPPRGSEPHEPRSPQPRSLTHQSEPPDHPSEGSGCLPGTRLPYFYGRDNDNVLSWLQKIGMALQAARVPERAKLTNVAPLFRGDADSWFYSFMKGYPPGGPAPTYDEFKAAIIQKYESSEIRDNRLRAKLQSIQLAFGLSSIDVYITQFCTIKL